MALVIAARRYQEAFWIAESAPETSWLFLVSAIEAVANYWNPGREDPLELVRDWNPKLHEYLLKLGEPEKPFPG
jgi:hypothetical protein